MPLSPGQKLGPYEILAPIGAGGMGEIYIDLAPDGKSFRPADASGGAGGTTDAEPRDLPRKLLRRAAAEGAREEVASNHFPTAI